MILEAQHLAGNHLARILGIRYPEKLAGNFAQANKAAIPIHLIPLRAVTHALLSGSK